MQKMNQGASKEESYRCRPTVVPTLTKVAATAASATVASRNRKMKIEEHRNILLHKQSICSYSILAWKTAIAQGRTRHMPLALAHFTPLSFHLFTFKACSITEGEWGNTETQQIHLGKTNSNRKILVNRLTNIFLKKSQLAIETAEAGRQPRSRQASGKKDL